MTSYHVVITSCHPTNPILDLPCWIFWLFRKVRKPEKNKINSSPGCNTRTIIARVVYHSRKNVSISENNDILHRFRLYCRFCRTSAFFIDFDGQRTNKIMDITLVKEGTDRQAGRQTVRQTDRQTDRRAGKKDKQIKNTEKTNRQLDKRQMCLQ